MAPYIHRCLFHCHFQFLGAGFSLEWNFWKNSVETFVIIIWCCVGKNVIAFVFISKHGGFWKSQKTSQKNPRKTQFPCEKNLLETLWTSNKHGTIRLFFFQEKIQTKIDRKSPDMPILRSQFFYARTSSVRQGPGGSPTSSRQMAHVSGVTGDSVIAEMWQIGAHIIISGDIKHSLY